ncbi:hypothetical protein AN478_07020 [Thiohalorhabdus denitrificans]|uniref:Exonuclease n=1 Tax=Thiohalorhabdus denitrificans TaxID=381306 RepID=A0A0N8PMX5_9GAMM|nr:hypothetical protein [Thiohalorhabdus denitrificans]KPV39941.1 hypothetical protein AN478_07020 [Thiohalorhabdus denitrificans]SCY09224.1 hypothetical protein SAMN05661077_1164 [Thiohalorhabdus denitrificans]
MPIFLDFEASGLGPASYPLEVAWGDTQTGAVEAHLIDPTPIPEWDDPIDTTAWMMHGLSRDYLAAHGEPPDRVARRMNEALAGRTAYCTAIHYDGMWLGELFADPEWEPAFGLQDVDRLWEGLLAGGPAERIEQADAAAWKRMQAEGWQPHRAEADVRHLMTMYRILALGY